MGKLMGAIGEHKRKQKLGRLEREVLLKIETTGILLPFDLYTGGYGTKENPKRLRKLRFAYKERLGRMVRKGLLKTVRKAGGKLGYDLSAKGEELAESISIGELKIEKPWRWDGKWHLVSFDIPEKRRDARDELRSTLQTIGLANIQKSLWVYPYDCREVIELIRRKHRITREVRYFVVDEMEFDHDLREQFELPT
ncbi:MAG TPA: hypothetical protein VI953_00980 [Candidatus Paceibacterota bacterium]